MANELDQLIKEVNLPSAQNTKETQYNPFDAPVPGESLTTVSYTHLTLPTNREV